MQVISFLDLNRLEIDSLNKELQFKNEALRASVDVLTSVNAQAVILLFLNHISLMLMILLKY